MLKTWLLVDYNNIYCRYLHGQSTLLVLDISPELHQISYSRLPVLFHQAFLWKRQDLHSWKSTRPYPLVFFPTCKWPIIWWCFPCSSKNPENSGFLAKLCLWEQTPLLTICFTRTHSFCSRWNKSRKRSLLLQAKQNSISVFCLAKNTGQLNTKFASDCMTH